MSNLRTYSEMILRSTFEDRFDYLNLHGIVGELTHGSFRYLNQRFYSSREWRIFRNQIIERDNGCDLAIPGREIYGKIILHHMVPITVEMLKGHDDLILDPENVVCVSIDTHNDQHYGVFENTPQEFKPRTINDTTLWKRGINV